MKMFIQSVILKNFKIKSSFTETLNLPLEKD